MKAPQELEEMHEQAEHFEVLPLIREIPTDTLTPVSALLRLKQMHAGPAFLLESCGPDLNQSRYSFVGVHPQEILTVQDGQLLQNRDGQQSILATEAPLDALKDYLQALKSPPNEDLPAFSGGYVGYMGYDCIRYLEDISLHDSDGELPEACLMCFQNLLIFDHLKHRILLLANIFPALGNLEQQYKQALEQLHQLKQALYQISPDERPLQLEASTFDIPQGEMGEAVFCQAVARIKEAIRQGETFQTVISERFVQELNVPPFLIYRILRSLSPSPYLFYLEMGEQVLLGGSPEMLIKAEGQRIATCPIAGTRPRGRNKAADLAYETEMLACEKERAEHLMLVDLGRNDLGRVAEPGSVEVTQYMEVERFSHVMHLVSKVEAELKEGLSGLDALFACFPAGTLSGAPKVRAMELIAELEPFRRSWYGGCIFYHGFNGHLDSAITIRSLALNGNRAVIQAGAGVVADSIPEHEYKEVRNKARAMFQTLAIAKQTASKIPSEVL